MKLRELVLMSLALPVLVQVQGYDATTHTVNQWNSVDIESGTVVEDTASTRRYELRYQDGDVLGTKASQATPGGSTITDIIHAHNMTAPGDARTKPITEATIVSPGTLHLIHVDDGSTISHQNGVEIYNSNSSAVERSETNVTFDTKAHFDITTHENYMMPYYPIFSVLDVTGQGNSSGNVTKPVASAHFKKAVDMTINSNTAGMGGTNAEDNARSPSNRINGVFAQTNQGGESHIRFDDTFTMATRNHKDGVGITHLRFENKGENRFHRVSEANSITDFTKGGSTATFNGNITSTMTNSNIAALRFLSITNHNGGMHVNANQGVTSTITNHTTSNDVVTLNVSSTTRDNGFSDTNLKGDTNLNTTADAGSVWGLYVNGESKGENRVAFTGANNTVATTGKKWTYGIDVSASGEAKNKVTLHNTNVTTTSTSPESDSAWTYGVRTTSDTGDTTITLKDSKVTTSSAYVARGIDIADENKGKNTINVDTTMIETTAKFAYGVNVFSNSDSKSVGDNTIRFTGTSSLVSTGTSLAYGVRIEKNKSNTGVGTKVVTDVGSTVTVNSKSNGTAYGISTVHNAAANNTSFTHDGNVAVSAQGNVAHGIYSVNKVSDSKIISTYNKDITVSAQGATANGVYYESTGPNAEITSTYHKDVNVAVQATNGNGMYYKNNGSGSTISSTYDSSVNLTVGGATTANAINQDVYASNSTTRSTFNGDVNITMAGPGVQNRVVWIRTKDGVTDAKNEAIFRKKLTIAGSYRNGALLSTGDGSHITVTGDDDVKISGSVFSAAKGVVDLNLMTDKSFLVGVADNLSTVNPANKGTVNMKMANQSQWVNLGNSVVDTLDISSGATIDFLDKDQVASLVVNDLKGSGGIFNMQGDVKTGVADTISIKHSSSGLHYVNFENTANAKSTGHEYLKLIESAGDEANLKATFKLKNPNERVGIPKDTTGTQNDKAVVERGAYLYTLGRATDAEVVSIGDGNRNNWYLYPVKDNGGSSLTPGAKSGVNMGDAMYQMNLVSTSTLVQRLGELHLTKDMPHSHDLWAKHVRGQYRTARQGQSGEFKNDYWGLQIGYDWLKPRGEWLHYVGMALGFTQSVGTFEGYSGSSGLHGYDMSAYSTWVNKNTNVYVDLVGKGTRYGGNYSITNYSGEQVRATDVNSASYMISAEVGKRIYGTGGTDTGWYVEPEAQLTYSFTNGYNFTTSNGLQIRTDATRSLVGRVGLRIGKDQIRGTGVSPYVKAMYEREFLGTGTYHFNHVSTEQVVRKGGWFTYGLGVTYTSPNKNHHVYLEAQRSSKHGMQQIWQMNLGVRSLF